ncbi:hypothetical protein A9Q84_10465 [Halobacteriovorax marinus]|uniref:EcxA zinc-binding domain-containing protein n=1 Tax=Halobacteriovorax marinus TaxID=97084 RepID=A0A1Y5F7N9_9BACT|nr:hypothetical protein A9Q84_10465 [Halobacteriovorax marinus]
MKNLVFLGVLLLATACGNKEVNHTDTTPLLKPSKIVKSLSTEDNYNITIEKSALGHLFLMQSSIIDNPPSATGNPLASKVIYFRKNGPFIGMFESTSGKLVTDSVTTETLLAKFPVVFENNSEVTFNFEEGMKILFQKGSYYIADPKSDTSSESTYRILESFINEVELRDGNIFIDQYLRVEVPATSRAAASVSPVQIKYIFSSYKKNENFKSVTSPGFDYVGYFENHPVYANNEDGSINETQVVHIKKFDITKPIVFHVTNNVPKKYYQAVVDGVKYWNKAFSKEVISVETLPSDVKIFEPGYNIVQWLDWDTAGFAYAASSSDPLTGEIKQAHVFMTSSFAKGSYRSAKTYLERFDKEDKANIHHLSLQGFTSTLTCRNKEERMQAESFKLKELIEVVEAGTYTDEEKEVMYVRYVSDYIREVVAHEVGHTLGFRHNFAASLDSNVDSSNYEALAKNYLKTGLLETEVNVGSSVMDYTPGFFSNFIGAKIRLENDALAYDQHAINVAYKGASKISELQYCTDGDAGKFFDCFRFDAFTNIMESKQFFMKSSMKNLVHIMLKKQFSLLANNELSEDQKVTAINMIQVPGEEDGSWLAEKRFKPLIEKAKLGKKSTMLERTYSLAATREELAEYQAKTAEKVTKDFLKIGGMNQVLFKNITPIRNGDLLATPVAHEMIALTKKLAPAYYEEFLTEKIKKAIDAKMKVYALDFDRMFLLYSLQYLDQKFAVKEAGFAKDVTTLTATVINTLDSKVEVISESGLLKPTFDFKINRKSLRKEAVDLAKSDFFPGSHSFKREMKKLNAVTFKSFKTLKETILGTFSTIESTPDDIYDYFMDEKKLYSPLK